MKLLVLGLGQCGGRIADRFARLNKRGHALRGMDTLAGVFAVNTDVTDLSGLRTIKPDYKHRILIGAQRTNGHGVGKISELGAEIANEDVDKIVDAIRTAEGFYETDAFLLCASAAGGTGSGSIGVLTKHLKERYIGKPVYNIVVFPFKEAATTETRTIYNTATCLKSTYLVADAVFLIDNQRYVKKDAPAENNLNSINARVVEPFYNVLCAGEETNRRFVGSKVLDAGDIIQTLSGWTVIGGGTSRLERRLPFCGPKRDFREKMSDTSRAVHSMDQAISELSMTIDPGDAGRAMYLLTAPAREMSMDVMKQLGDNLRNLAPNALIRSGDYPRDAKQIDVTIVLSEIGTIRKVTEYFTKAIDLISVMKAKRGLGTQTRRLEESFDEIPVLL